MISKQLLSENDSAENRSDEGKVEEDKGWLTFDEKRLMFCFNIHCNWQTASCCLYEIC
jgi:hypothetical protein